jgi:hypothetical protein
VSLGTALLTETAFTTAVTAFAWALVRAARLERLRDYALAGALLGVTALLRPTLQYLPLVLVPAIAWLATRRGWRAGGTLLLAFALVFGPWLVRNQVQLGRTSDPELMATAVLHGSYPDLMYAGRPETRGFPYRADPAAASIHTTGQALGRIVANLRADPAGTLRWYLVGKPIQFHAWAFVEGAGDVFINTLQASPYFTRPEFALTHRVMRMLHAPLMWLGLAGLVAAAVALVRRRRDAGARAFALLAVTMAFVIALHMVIFPLARYSVPFRPLQFVFALHAVVLALAWVRARRA